MATIAVGVNRSDGLLVELGEKDVSDGAMNALGSRLQEVRKANVQPAFAQSDSRVERSKAVETNIQRRNGRTRTKIAVLLFKDGDECGRHCFSRLTRGELHPGLH